MFDYITYFTIIIIAILAVLYIRKQITLSQNIRIEDTTLEKLDEKLKKHKLIGGRHKRTNKKNPPIV
jgi:biopolymer transport protein ExbB/TolQ